MSETPLSRLQDEVIEQGKDIRQLRVEMDEMRRWREAQSGMQGHMITWGLMLLAVIVEAVAHLWGK